MNLQEYLHERRLITDGAMGTYYEKKYGTAELFPEEENLLHPDRICDIHFEYLQAGARLLRTNTFATNPVFVPDAGRRLEGLRAGYAIAETAVERFRKETGSEEDIFIAADFGPIGELEEQSPAEVLADYEKF